MISRTIGWFGFGIPPTLSHHHIEHTLTVGAILAIHLHAAVQNICSMLSFWFAKGYMPHVIDSPRSMVLFHNIFFSSGEQPEPRIAAHEL